LGTGTEPATVRRVSEPRRIDPRPDRSSVVAETERPRQPARPARRRRGRTSTGARTKRTRAWRSILTYVLNDATW